jgi:hypothetical protein
MQAMTTSAINIGHNYAGHDYIGHDYVPVEPTIGDEPVRHVVVPSRRVGVHDDLLDEPRRLEADAVVPYLEALQCAEDGFFFLNTSAHADGETPRGG